MSQGEAPITNPATEVPPGENEPIGTWFRRNLSMFIIFAGLIALAHFKWGADLIDFRNIGIAILGLGFIIFIHELGHFAVAKWCDVHVQTFSIGFGPALPGCSFRWGETLYKISVIPLGGYVAMVGENHNEDEDEDPRSFRRKTVFQRMAIISAGVIMNLIFGFACFVFVFMTRGEERTPGVIDHVDAGSPAWAKGVRTGDVIHQIGNRGPTPSFDQLQPAVMLTSKGQLLDFKFGPSGVPADKLEMLKIEPRCDKEDKRPVIGIAPKSDLKLLPPFMSRNIPSPVMRNSAAANAKPSFEFGDEIIACSDPDQEGKVTDLPKDTRWKDGEKLDYFVFKERMYRMAGQEFVVRVKREGETIDIKVPPQHHYSLGMRMTMGKISAIRDHCPAEEAGVRVGDVIDKVEIRDGDKTIRYVNSPGKDLPDNVEERFLDPCRLPYELEQWAKKAEKKSLSLTVVRTNPESAKHKERDEKKLTLDWEKGWEFHGETQLGWTSSMPIPALGLAYKIMTTVADVVPDSPAAKAGLMKDDVIKEVQFKILTKDNKVETRRWTDVKPDQWAFVFKRFQQDTEVKEIGFRIEREKKTVFLEATEDTSWPMEERGLILMPDRRVHVAKSVGEAFQMGVDKTTGFIQQIYLNLLAMATGRVSTELLGGPLTIGRAAFDIAGENIYQFLLFLGIISVNLAVVNFLPIPMLDGGHMVFLIYEKIFGKPMPAIIQNVGLLLGITFLGTLMCYVIYLDSDRFGFFDWFSK